MSSTRLPGKVLLPLGDTTVLGSTISQVKGSRKIGRIVVATSEHADDDPIAAECKKLGVEVFRGSLEDVLDRYYQAAKRFNAENICRVTADCPLIDPAIIDRAAEEFEKEQPDYISTGREKTTYPDGMDTEIFSLKALERAWKEAKLPSEREHVTPYIWKHPEIFKLAEIQNDRDLSHVRLTLDEQADYDVLQDVVSHVRPVTMERTIAYLSSHPEIAAKNSSIERDEGYKKSVALESRSS